MTTTTMGRPSRYPNKLKGKPVTFTAPFEVLRKLERASERTGWTRADVVCALIDGFADQLQRPDDPPAD